MGSGVAIPIKACVFDAYGTLFDLHSAVSNNAVRVGPAAGAFSELWRTKQLEYSWIRSAMAPPSDGWKDFWQLTQDALDFAMTKFEVADPQLRSDLLEAYRALSPFPEARTMMEQLKSSGMRTAVLSNGTRSMLDAALTSGGLGGLINVVVSADDVKTFKPDPRLYQLVMQKLDIAANEVVFCSSNPWDAASAASFGFRVILINRSRHPREYPFATMAAERPDLREIPQLVRELSLG
jgi:2-haloacid dehalogenase